MQRRRCIICNRSLTTNTKESEERAKKHKHAPFNVTQVLKKHGRLSYDPGVERLNNSDEFVKFK